MALADRYNEVMQLREEGLAKYRASVVDVKNGPPRRLLFPPVSLRKSLLSSKKLGMLYVENKQPIFWFAEDAVRSAPAPLRILEIGPGVGTLAAYLQSSYGDKVCRYFGLDRDRAVSGRYEKIDALDDLSEPVDLVIASEVIEHMPADEFYETILIPLRRHMHAKTKLIVGTPNPLTPGGIARDFTHTQHYPWYDLYAIVRLEFASVEMTRLHFLWRPSRLALLPLRIAVCSIQELDWCEQLICVAERPRALL
ncbi:MAG: class I SAM-dependent methyltransferase [Vulcanimicrobiaceae bacterium]